jgi:hypothetical protein
MLHRSGGNLLQDAIDGGELPGVVLNAVKDLTNRHGSL